jgi:amino acid transporter
VILAANAVVTGIVAVSFGSYASAAFADGCTTWIKVFAVLLVLAMTLLNIVGSQAVARTHRLCRAHHPDAVCGHNPRQPRP